MTEKQYYTKEALEKLKVEKNGLKIIGVEGAELTILDGTGLSGNGIYVYANEVTVQELTITEFNFGIYLYRSEQCNIKGNVIHNIRSGFVVADGIGLFLSVCCHENKILNNIIYENDYFGIYIGYTRESGTCVNNVVNNNKIYDNAQGGAHGAGIRWRNADNTVIEKNEIYGHILGSYPYGIILRDSCDFNKVQNNYVHDNAKSIMIYRTSRYNKVQNNLLENNDVNYVELLDPELSIGNIIKNN